LPEHSTILPQTTAASPAAVKEEMPAQEQLLNEPDKILLQKTSIQFKLSIGAPDDPLEHEADAMADSIMRMPEQHFIQRKCSHCEEENLQRKPVASFIQRKESSAAIASDTISKQVNGSRGNGSSMDSSTQSFMQSRFGSDFSDVKIHTGGEATQMNRDLNAKAFTVGNDIYFNEGQYSPNSGEGKYLLTHELTHVVQQNSITQSNFIQRKDKEKNPPKASAEKTIEEIQMDAARTTFELLSEGLFNSVTPAEAHKVLEILEGLPPSVLLSLRVMMKLRGDWNRFIEKISPKDTTRLTGMLQNMDVDVGYIMPGDDIRIELYVDAEIKKELSLDYNVTSLGVRLMLIPEAVQISEMLPREAATKIAQTYIDEGYIYEPFVKLMVISRGNSYAPDTGNTHQSIWFESNIVIDRSAPVVMKRDRLKLFIEYISVTNFNDSRTVSARLYYYKWIDDNKNQPEFFTTEPFQAWDMALAKAFEPPPVSPLQKFLDFMRIIQSMIDVSKEEDKVTMQDTMTKYLDWLDNHIDDPEIDKYEPLEIWKQLYSISFDERMKRLDETHLRKAREKMLDAEYSPEKMEQRSAKWNEFYNLALKLWGYKAKNFPYVIPVPSQGEDILVWDDHRQVIYNKMGGELLKWATDHMKDENFTSADPHSILLSILKAGAYDQQLNEAGLKPVKHEHIDRHELLAGTVFSSFGEAIAKGLLAVAAVGAAVGLGIISAPVALVFIAGLAVYAGITSYFQRREQIERSGYDVPIPETMLHSIGDVVGLSQLIEGITGEKLGTGEKLLSIERSETLGEGGANIALNLVGSRAYRGAQRLGQNYRLSRPGLLPPGPEGGVQFPAREAARPIAPPPSSAGLGGVVEKMRNALPQELRVGFDMWIDEIVKGSKDPQEVLKKIPENKRLEVSTRRATDFSNKLIEAAKLEYAKARAADNPLNPISRFSKKIGDIEVLYNDEAALQRYIDYGAEIAQAQKIHNITGEPVRLFVDTVSGIEYPGIDGTIGIVPRPLSLKHGGAASGPQYARWAAGEAAVKAKANGYTHVEVRIEVEGTTIAEVLAAWDTPPALAKQGLSPVFDAGGTIARIIIHAKDGIRIINPPLQGPALPGVGIPDDNEHEMKR